MVEKLLHHPGNEADWVTNQPALLPADIHLLSQWPKGASLKTVLMWHMGVEIYFLFFEYDILAEPNKLSYSLGHLKKIASFCISLNL